MYKIYLIGILCNITNFLELIYQHNSNTLIDDKIKFYLIQDDNEKKI